MALWALIASYPGAACILPPSNTNAEHTCSSGRVQRSNEASHGFWTAAGCAPLPAPPSAEMMASPSNSKGSGVLKLSLPVSLSGAFSVWIPFFNFIAKPFRLSSSRPRQIIIKIGLGSQIAISAVVATDGVDRCRSEIPRLFITRFLQFFEVGKRRLPDDQVKSQGLTRIEAHLIILRAFRGNRP